MENLPVTNNMFNDVLKETCKLLKEISNFKIDSETDISINRNNHKETVISKYSSDQNVNENSREKVVLQYLNDEKDIEINREKEKTKRTIIYMGGLLSSCFLGMCFLEKKSNK